MHPFAYKPTIVIDLQFVLHTYNKLCLLSRYDSIPIQYSSDLQDVLGLLLTYEDFLRPTALMIIHHSALKAWMSSGSEEVEEDPLCHSLNPTVLLSSRNKERSSSLVESDKREVEKTQTQGDSGDTNALSANKCVVDDIPVDVGSVEQYSQTSSTKHLSSLCETYSVDSKELKPKILVSDGNNIFDGKSCNAVNECYEESAKNDVDFDTSIEEVYQAAKNLARQPPTVSRGPVITEMDLVKLTVSSSPIITEMDLVKLECACGGMSPNRWRERVLALREAEAAVRERELDMREREREVVLRERRVTAMEREARQHLVRAQIYLKQSRQRKNAATSPNRPPSDMDTSVSADVGDEDVQTIAKPDPHRIDNPFLKMRGLQGQAEKRVSFKAEKPSKFKSNTLDNPKSRRKRGNIFGLVERSSENKKDKEEVMCAPELRNPLQPISVVNDTGNNIRTKQQNQKPNSDPCHNQEKTNQCILNLRKNSKENLKVTPVGLQQRCRSSENLSRRSVESVKNKENVPVQGTKVKKVPEVKECLRTFRTSNRVLERLAKKEGIGRNGQKVPALQFYNVV